MKRMMSMVVIAMMVAGSAAFACDTCGCSAKKEKPACTKCTDEKKCEACTKKAEAAKKAEEAKKAE